MGLEMLEIQSLIWFGGIKHKDSNWRWNRKGFDFRCGGKGDLGSCGWWYWREWNSGIMFLSGKPILSWEIFRSFDMEQELESEQIILKDTGFGWKYKNKRRYQGAEKVLTSDVAR